MKKTLLFKLLVFAVFSIFSLFLHVDAQVKDIQCATFENGKFSGSSVFYYVSSNSIFKGRFGEKPTGRYPILHKDCLWYFYKMDNRFYIFNAAYGMSYPFSLDVKKYDYQISNIERFHISRFGPNNGYTKSQLKKYLFPILSVAGTYDDYCKAKNLLEEERNKLGVEFSPSDENGNLIKDKAIWYNLITIPENQKKNGKEAKECYIGVGTVKEVESDSLLYHLDEDYLWAFSKSLTGFSLYSSRGVDSEKPCYVNLEYEKNNDKVCIFTNEKDTKVYLLASVFSRSRTEGASFTIQRIGNNESIRLLKQDFNKKLEEDSIREITKLQQQAEAGLQLLADKYGSDYLTELVSLNIIVGMPIDLLKEEEIILKYGHDVDEYGNDTRYRDVRTFSPLYLISRLKLKADYGNSQTYDCTLKLGTTTTFLLSAITGVKAYERSAIITVSDGKVESVQWRSTNDPLNDFMNIFNHL